MSPQAQQIQISKFLGYRTIDGDDQSAFWKDYDDMNLYSWDIPDWLNDLNAMHKAEKVLLKKDKYSHYKWEIAKIIHPNKNDLNPSMLDNHVICAPACVRAEAFLKTVGLWS